MDKKDRITAGLVDVETLMAVIYAFGRALSQEQREVAADFLNWRAAHVADSAQDQFDLAQSGYLRAFAETALLDISTAGEVLHATIANLKGDGSR